MVVFLGLQSTIYVYLNKCIQKILLVKVCLDWYNGSGFCNFFHKQIMYFTIIFKCFIIVAFAYNNAKRCWLKWICSTNTRFYTYLKGPQGIVAKFSHDRLINSLYN